MHANFTVLMADTPRSAAPNVHDRGCRDMWKFRAHFVRSLRKLPAHLPLEQQSALILTEIQD